MKALYDIENDWMMTKNLKDELNSVAESMQHELKAIIQSYMQRMVGNELVVRKPSGK